MAGSLGSAFVCPNFYLHRMIKIKFLSDFQPGSNANVVMFQQVQHFARLITNVRNYCRLIQWNFGQAYAVCSVRFCRYCQGSGRHADRSGESPGIHPALSISILLLTCSSSSATACTSSQLNFNFSARKYSQSRCRRMIASATFFPSLRQAGSPGRAGNARAFSFSAFSSYR